MDYGVETIKTADQGGVWLVGHR